MRIETLENFIAISREESISLAAEKMHISQPALSQQLAGMEKELGVKLFVRDTRKLKLTDEHGDLKKLTLEYPDNFNFGYDVVDKIAAETPDKRALVWCNVEGEEHFFTFADIKKHSNKMANVFRAAGIGHGDRVMLILKRHYEYWFAAVALHKLGAVMIPATHMLTVSDLVYRIKASKVNAVVCTSQNEVPEKLLEALKQSDITAKLWCVQADVDGFENITSVMETASDELERIPTKATDPMMLYFTSGTTGYPKGVIHEHSYEAEFSYYF